MAAKMSSQLRWLLIMKEAWAKGQRGAWDEECRSYVKSLLTSLQTADGAATSTSTCSNPLLEKLSETAELLITEFDEQKKLFSKTSSELWRSLSIARLDEALDIFNAAEQSYREYINKQDVANIAAAKVWKFLHACKKSSSCLSWGPDVTSSVVATRQSNRCFPTAASARMRPIARYTAFIRP